MASLPEGRLARLPRVRRRRLRAVARGLGFVALTLTLLPLFAGLGCLRGMPRFWLQRLWCRLSSRLLGLEVRFQGEPLGACATLFLANHVSYLDILLLGARIDARFVAKAEVAGWPLFGAIGRAAGTFFIRRRRRDVLIQRNALAARMRAGESFILFAEGTSTNGMDVLPLKTSLLSVAEPWILDRPIAVQPVTLAYRRLRDGTPFTLSNARRFAWFGEDRMLPHLWALLHEDGCAIDVVLGEPVMSWAVASRKVLGREVRQQLQATLSTPDTDRQHHRAAA